MIINHNIAAINTYRMLSSNSGAQSKTLEKLSSGLRINRAADDAAGLAISEKMRGQIRGLTQAVRNTQDAISMIQTAEGALGSVHDMLQRGRELAIQAANSTLTDPDRAKLNEELQQIKEQIDVVAENTEFNTIKMLNNTKLQHADLISTIKERLQYWVDDSLTAITANLGLSASYTNKPMAVEFYEDPNASTAASMGTVDGSSLTLRINLSKVAEVYNSSDDGWGQVDALIAHEVVHALQFTEMSQTLNGNIDTWFIEGMATALQGGVPFLNTLSSKDAAHITSTWNGDYGSAYAAVMTLHEITDGGLGSIIDRLEAGDTLDQAINSTARNSSGEITSVPSFTNAQEFVNWFNTSADVDAYLNNSADFTNPVGTIAPTGGDIRTGVTSYEDVIANDTTIDNGSVFVFQFQESNTSGSDQPYIFHIGANEAQSVTMNLVDASTAGLGISGVEFLNQEAADEAITTLNNAIEKVSEHRSYFGALQNRLEHTISNLMNTSENLTSAESRIRDADMAEGMMDFTKNNILTQAAQAMLAQANQQPQGVLQLLR